MNHPLFLLVLTAGGLHLLRLWILDLRAHRQGHPNHAALPGAVPTGLVPVLVGIAGALIILAAETAGEIALGVASEQTRITWLLALYSVGAAPVIEEIIFRGWIVVENRGRMALWLGAAVASLLFAALHPYAWQWDEAGFRFTPDTKGLFSTAVVFATSLWFYAARFGRWNPQRSLLPCFAAHAAKNVGVVAIKAAGGFVSGPW